MKRIELPKEAIFKGIGFGANKKLSNEKFWFYEEFQKGGGRSHWKMNLYDCGIQNRKKLDELDMSFQKYLMIFEDREGWKVEFEFRNYLDPIFAGDFAIYRNYNYMSAMCGENFIENISEECEEYSDLAGCCKSAMYYVCSRL